MIDNKENQLSKKPEPNISKTDQRTPIERIIASNPCRKCSIKKLGHCECMPAQGAGEICSSEELALTPEYEEENNKKTIEDEWDQIENELLLELSLNKKVMSDDFADWLHLNKLAFDPLIISEMLARKLLFIDNNKDLGIFSIFLGYQHKLLPQQYQNELKKYFAAILSALETFKLVNVIGDDCALIERDELNQNIIALRINFPRPVMFALFIEHLTRNNLIPIQNIEQSERRNLNYAEGINHFLTNPLDTRLTRNNNTGVRSEQEQEEDQRQFRGTRPRSLLDGLKRFY